MGMDPSAHLWFGIVLEQGENPMAPRDENGEIDYEDWEALEEEGYDFRDLGAHLARKQGVEDPYRSAPDDDPEFSEWHEANKQAIEDYRDLRKRLEDEAPIEIIDLKSEDGEDWFGIAVKHYSYRSDWNKADSVRTTWPEPHRVVAAKEWCAEHGFPEFTDAKWLLTASYG